MILTDLLQTLNRGVKSDSFVANNSMINIIVIAALLVICASLYVLIRFRPSHESKGEHAPPAKNVWSGISKRALDRIRDQFKIEARPGGPAVQFLFVRSTGVAEARIALVFANQSQHPVAVKKIAWELWLGQLVKSTAVLDPIEIPENTLGVSYQLVELLTDKEKGVASRGSSLGNLHCYAEGTCYCRTKLGDFEKKFALLNLGYEILGDAELRQIGQGTEIKIDSLTGFMQRNFIEENMQAVIDRTGGRHPISLIMIDLDNFKMINDKYGHLAGDEALKIVCQQIKDAIADRGVPVRYGGDEFAILLEYCESQDAEYMAERILEGVRQCHFHISDQEWNVTLSIGVATLHQLADYKVLIKKADDMLLRSKQEGRNRVSVDRFDRRVEGRDRRRG